MNKAGVSPLSCDSPHGAAVTQRSSCTCYIIFDLNDPRKDLALKKKKKNSLFPTLPKRETSSWPESHQESSGAEVAIKKAACLTCCLSLLSTLCLGPSDTTESWLWLRSELSGLFCQNCPGICSSIRPLGIGRPN